MEPTATGGAAGGTSSGVQNAIAQYKQVQDESAEKSLRVTIQTTQIRGEADAIRKIS